jgi:hypothetical protein
MSVLRIDFHRYIIKLYNSLLNSITLLITFARFLSGQEINTEERILYARISFV